MSSRSTRRRPAATWWPLPRPWENPLPFDDDLQAAPAYWGIVDATRLPARPADVLRPGIAGRSAITVTSPRASGVKVKYDLPSAIDTLDGPVPVSCLPASKTRFAVGTTF